MPKAVRVPPTQKPVELAYQLAVDAIRSSPPSSASLEALGASATPDGIRLPALNRHLIIRPEAGEVVVEGNGMARLGWAVLALQYLCARDVPVDAREVSLAHFPDCRGYVGPFTKRVIGRFLRTVGQTAHSFSTAGEEIGGRRMPGPGVSYRFDVLPRIPIALVLFEGDEEFAAGANVLFRADAQYLLPPGTVVAAAEMLVGALCGQPVEVGIEERR